MQMKDTLFQWLLIGGIVLFVTSPAQAQGTSLEAGGGMIWGALGFQADLGGNVNSPGVGTVSGQRAEINANTWAERYDSALLFRIGGAYNLDYRSQIFGTLSWEQAEADPAVAGLIGGRDLEVTFTDYQGWGLDGGYRFFFDAGLPIMPFLSASLGFQRVQEITITMIALPFAAREVPFYADSWVTQWRVGTGFIGDFNRHFGWQATLDIKYTGVLSDDAGIGTLGFERINNVANRWTLPFMGGIYVQF
jgi:hypothetical protein